jgi:hypothetical protein
VRPGLIRHGESIVVFNTGTGLPYLDRLGADGAGALAMERGAGA